MTGDIEIFDGIPICFGSILSYSRDGKKRERETRRFLEKVLEFQRVSRRCECRLVVGFVFPQRGRIEKSEEGRAREEGAKCTPVLRDVTFTFYVYSLRL